MIAEASKSSRLGESHVESPTKLRISRRRRPSKGYTAVSAVSAMMASNLQSEFAIPLDVKIILALTILKADSYESAVDAEQIALKVNTTAVNVINRIDWELSPLRLCKDNKSPEYVVLHTHDSVNSHKAQARRYFICREPADLEQWVGRVEQDIAALRDWRRVLGKVTLRDSDWAERAIEKLMPVE